MAWLSIGSCTATRPSPGFVTTPRSGASSRLAADAESAGRLDETWFLTLPSLQEPKEYADIIRRRGTVSPRTQHTGVEIRQLFSPGSRGRIEFQTIGRRAADVRLLHAPEVAQFVE